MIQCIVMNGHQFYVRAISQRRRAEWDRIFGSDELPVRSCQPAPTSAGCLAYRLDERRLHWMQRERLVNWLVKRYRMTYQDARWTVADGLPISVADAALIHDERESQTAPAFLILEAFRHWPYQFVHKSPYNRANCRIVSIRPILSLP